MHRSNCGQSRFVIGLTIAAIFWPLGTVGAAPPPVVLIDIDTLVFEPPDLEEPFKRFDRVARRFAADQFEYLPYRLGGNFVSAEWRKGPVIQGNLRFPGGIPPAEDIHKFWVETIVVPPPLKAGGKEDPNRPPRARSVGIGASLVSNDPERWCVGWNYRRVERGGGGVTGSSWGITFYRWDPARLKTIVPFRPHDQARERIHLPVIGYAVSDVTSVNLRPRPLHDDFIRHVRSPESLRDTYLADLAKQEEMSLEVLQKHEATKLVVISGGSKKMPPQYERVLLTSEEEAAATLKAKTYFASQRRLMEEHYVTLYKALRELFPIDECWDELKR